MEKFCIAAISFFVGFAGLGALLSNVAIKPQKKDYFDKVNTQTFIEISTRLEKIDSLYFEIDSLTKTNN